MNLSGQWEFALDPQNHGIAESWQSTVLSGRVQLPGCLQAQGYGFPPGPDTRWWGKSLEKPMPWEAHYRTADNFRFQAFLVPSRHYIGAAWYAREFTVPAAWNGKSLCLYLERAHWRTEVWLDGMAQGSRDSLATPHRYELGILPEGPHRLSIRVDNSEIVPLGAMPHSVSEQTAGTWNGIVGRIELQAQAAVSIESIRVLPHVAEGKVVIEWECRNRTGAAKEGMLSVVTRCLRRGEGAAFDSIGQKASLPPGTHELRLVIPLKPGAARWDEFDPVLHELELALTTDATSDQRTARFGLRDFSVHGSQFAINGATTFLRGNVDCAEYPKTGYAPMEVESWLKIFRTYKEVGLNMARFHSWCPPEAAFVAADELGIYLAPEAGEWATINRPDQKQFLTEESRRILREYACHPSFVMMGLGNENGGDREFFRQLIEDWKNLDPGRCYTIKANSNANPSNIDYEVLRWNRLTKESARYQEGWPPKPESSLFNTKAPQTEVDWRKAVQQFAYPILQHETAQICAQPNPLTELPKFTGYLRAGYLEIEREQLSERGLLGQIDAMVAASGQWQMELTREEFEAAFRTPGLAGFNWLCLADFTGQTTAPVGFADAFYDLKPYVDAARVRRWNAPTVLLARMPKRILTRSETWRAEVEVAHFGKAPLKLTDLTATMRNSQGEVIKTWKLPSILLEQGAGQPIGKIELPLVGIAAPAKLNVLIQSTEAGLANDWNVWIYPDTPTESFPASITVAHEWNAGVRQQLDAGQTVLLLPPNGTLRGNLPICFTPYYWTSFGAEGGQSSANGLLIDPGHPLFSAFPTENHTDWQWWDLLTRCQPMILDSYDSRVPWPKDYRPLIQPIDSWKINRKLALVAEAKFSRGKLLICTINLEDDLENRPATRQFRQSLMAYLTSKDFVPKTEISAEMLAELFDRTRPQSPVEPGGSLPNDG